MKGGISSIFGPYEAASLVYGGYLGLGAPTRPPKNIDDARRKANLGYAVGKGALDIGVGFIDDAVFILGAPLLARRIPGLKVIEPGVRRVAGIVGFGVAGGLLGREVNDYAAAKAYLARSQAAIPDSRIGAVTGFINQGPVAAQRLMKTGIGSPAAGGIMYRMNNNPYADLLNRFITDPVQENKVRDPISTGLSYQYIGSAIGGALGSKHGIGRMTAYGMIGGFMGGAYGLRTAHNPSLQANLQAIGVMAAMAAPTLALGGAVFAMALNGGRLGSVVRNGLTRGTAALGRSGRALAAGSQALEKNSARAAIKLTVAGGEATSRLFASNTLTNIDAKIAAYGNSAMSMLLRKPVTNMIPSTNLSTLLDKGIGYGTVGAANLLSGIGSTAGYIGKDVIAPMLIKTQEAKNIWEQSLGLAHLAVFVPHQVAAAAIAMNAVSKHGTNILAANGGQR